jgi:4-diphosphocytidyl-2-C-methyl-D-erythritol kinase
MTVALTVCKFLYACFFTSKILILHSIPNPNNHCPLLRAYAKINLGLLVFDKRPDGYHNIETVLHRIDLYDEVHFEPDPSISVISSDPEAPGDKMNICFKAAELLQQNLEINNGVKITLNKNIPVGAGLGGGSANAALVLRELPRFWHRSIDEKALQSMALQLGSDVPYFLGSGSALARGRGEILDYFRLDVPYSIVLCYPNIHVSTSWAYGHATIQSENKHGDLAGLVRGGMKDPRLLLELRNDFEAVVFGQYPEILGVKELMMHEGAELSMMSGSGSSVFGLYSRAQSASQVARQLQLKGYKAFTTGPHFSLS